MELCVCVEWSGVGELCVCVESSGGARRERRCRSWRRCGVVLRAGVAGHRGKGCHRGSLTKRWLTFGRGAASSAPARRDACALGR